MSAPDKERGRRGSGDLRETRSFYTPSAAVSYEDARKVWNQDLPELSPSQLANEAFIAARLTARDPRACVWRGMTPISWQTYADERIRKIYELLSPTPPPRRKPMPSKGWV